MTDEIAAPDDKTVRWRLKHPFPMLPQALGKVGAIVAFIMPERLASGDSAVAVKELVGSGPFRFRADQHVPGSLLVYEKFAAYVPNPNGPDQPARRAEESCISTAWSGRWCRMAPPPAPRCSGARWIGGTSRSSTCCRS